MDTFITKTAVVLLLVGSVYGQFLQDPCLRKRCDYGTACRLVAQLCEHNATECHPTPECVPAPMFGISRFNPCPVSQPILNVRLHQIVCGRDQCPEKSYCSAPTGLGVCCYDFKGSFLGNKYGLCRNPPRMFGRCQDSNCRSDQECGFLKKCCPSACGFTCQMSFVG